MSAVWRGGVRAAGAADGRLGSFRDERILDSAAVPQAGGSWRFPAMSRRMPFGARTQRDSRKRTSTFGTRRQVLRPRPGRSGSEIHGRDRPDLRDTLDTNGGYVGMTGPPHSAKSSNSMHLKVKCELRHFLSIF